MADSRLEIILAGKDASAAAFKAVQGRISTLTRSIFSLKGGLATLGIGYGFSRLAADVLDVASSFEQMEVKLDALTRGRGKQTLEEINAWALEMPVNTRKAVDTFAMMQAMGLDPTIAKMQTLVDVSSIFGEDAMPRVARALGQLTALGKLSAEELNQLAESGINARKYLTQAFGMTVEELQKSQISIEQIVNAIWQGLNADFSGAAAKAQNSWKGLTLTFRSYLEEISRMVMDAGVFEAMKTGLAEINRETKTWIEANDDLIAQKVPEYLDQVAGAAKGAYEQANRIYGIYQALPDEIVGVAGAGIIGRILFGATPAGRIATGLLMINEAMKSFQLNLGSLVDSYRELDRASKNVWDVITGRRDWQTGELKGGPTVIRKPMPARPEPLPAIAALPEIPAPPETALQKLQAAAPAYDQTWAPGELERFYRHDALLRDAQQANDQISATSEQTYEAMDAHVTAWKEHTEAAFAGIAELSERTAWAMQENFSSLFFDAMQGEFKSLEDYAQGILTSLNRAVADFLGQQLVQGLFGSLTKSGGGGGWINSLFSAIFGNAQGNAFAPAGVKRYGAGGVVTDPTLFAYAGGIGLMGERGHEAVMPLGRTRRGELGVKTDGARPVVNTFNITVQTPTGSLDRQSINELRLKMGQAVNRAMGRN